MNFRLTFYFISYSRPDQQCPANNLDEAHRRVSRDHHAHRHDYDAHDESHADFSFFTFAHLAAAAFCAIFFRRAGLRFEFAEAAPFLPRLAR
jgi:hypothetical protein